MGEEKVADKDYFMVDGEVTAELEVGVSGTLLVRKGQPLTPDLIEKGIKGVAPEQLPADEGEAAPKSDVPETENKSAGRPSKK